MTIPHASSETDPPILLRVARELSQPSWKPRTSGAGEARAGREVGRRSRHRPCRDRNRLCVTGVGVHALYCCTALPEIKGSSLQGTFTARRLILRQALRRRGRRRQPPKSRKIGVDSRRADASRTPPDASRAGRRRLNLRLGDASRGACRGSLPRGDASGTGRRRLLRRLEGAFHGRRRGRRRLGAEEAYAYPS